MSLLDNPTSYAEIIESICNEYLEIAADDSKSITSKYLAGYWLYYENKNPVIALEKFNIRHRKANSYDPIADIIEEARVILQNLI